MTKLLPALALIAAPLLVGCGGSRIYTNEDVPTISKLGDLMWAQAQASDPAFKLIGKAQLADADFALATTAGERLKLTAPRIKMMDSKGPDYDALADKLAAQGDELASAAVAKDAAKVGVALAATKDTCKTCHKKFR